MGRDKELTAGDCSLQRLVPLRKQLYTSAIFLPFPEALEVWWGKGTQRLVQKAVWDQITTYSFPERQVLGYSLTVNISKTPQADRSRRFAVLRRTQGVPRNVWISELDGRLLGRGSFSMWILRRQSGRDTLSFPLSVCIFLSLWCLENVFADYSPQGKSWSFPLIKPIYPVRAFHFSSVSRGCKFLPEDCRGRHDWKGHTHGQLSPSALNITRLIPVNQ